MSRRLRQGGSWAVGILLLVGAWLAITLTPTTTENERPFRTELAQNEQVSSRVLAGTLKDVRLTEHVTAGDWSAEGLWLVIDLDIVATTEPTNLRYAWLERAGGERHRATERADSLVDTALSPGLVLNGSVAFELPESERDGVVRVDLGHMLVDTRADGLLSLTLDLSDLTLEATAEIHPAEWAQ